MPRAARTRRLLFAAVYIPFAAVPSPAGMRESVTRGSMPRHESIPDSPLWSPLRVLAHPCIASALLRQPQLRKGKGGGEGALLRPPQLLQPHQKFAGLGDPARIRRFTKHPHSLKEAPRM